MKWYLKAAGQGYADAQSSLGVCYAKGEGVTIDKVEAYKWFSLASNQRVQNAKKGLSLLEQEMTKEQIARAQRLAREFEQRKTAEQVKSSLDSDDQRIP